MKVLCPLTPGGLLPSNCSPNSVNKADSIKALDDKAHLGNQEPMDFGF